MRKRGYADGLATGSIAAGGTLGILIPPSITMIVYGIATETSIGRLFLAGLLPGLMLTGLFVAWGLIQARLASSGAAASEPQRPPASAWREKLRGAAARSGLS